MRFCLVVSFMNCRLTPGIIQLPRATQKCPKCKERDAVYFQSQQRAADTGMVSVKSQSLLGAKLTTFIEAILCVYSMQSCLHSRLSEAMKAQCFKTIISELMSYLKLSEITE
jgi:Transcription factor S-II (TFIIS)